MNSRSATRWGAIVLCGGESKRMGVDKATLPFGTELLVQRAVRQLHEFLEPVAVVAATNQTLPSLAESTLLARDRRPGQGPLEGLLAGMKVIADRADAVFVTSCDAPFLEPAFVRYLFDVLGDHDVAVPVEDGRFHPLAAVYRTSLIERIEHLLAQDCRRLRAVFDASRTLTVPVEQIARVAPELRTLLNLNCPEDYLDALAIAGLPAPDRRDLTR